MNHAACPRTMMIENPIEPGRIWRCAKCSKVLATMRLGPIVLDSALRPLDVTHDGMPAYGVPRRVLTGKHGDAARSAVTFPQVKTAIYLFCPRVGRNEERCGLGQHLLA